MLRKGSAAAIPLLTTSRSRTRDCRAAAGFRRNLMVTVDCAAFSHKFLEHLDTLAARRGYTLIYSCGWELGERRKPRCAWSPSTRGRSRWITARGPRAPR